MWFAVFWPVVLEVGGGAVGIYFSYCAAVVGTVLMYTMVGTKHQKTWNFQKTSILKKGGGDL